MLCQMFRRRKKKGHNVSTDPSFTKKSDENRHIQNTHSSNWFSQDVNLMPKDFNYLFSLIEKCLKLCVKKDINFKTNPPYLPSILRNFNNKIMSIVKYYEHDISELSDIYFFRVSMWTLMKQCKEILRIFRKAKSSVCDELSVSRQKLIHVSFLLSHLFHSLVALFPNSFYAPESFRITKSDAAEWWNSHFGSTTTVVKWKDFFHVFSKLNYTFEVSNIAALKRTINITGNGFVSIFDFDVFVRLFQPWKSIIESWQIIALEHPGCMPLLTYEQVVQILKSFKYYPGAGSYIFRFSCTKPGQWAIGYVDVSGKIFQTIVHNKSLALALCEGEQAGIYKFPNGKYFDSSIVHSLQAIPPEKVIVSQDEHDAYSKIDSSFEVCKICELNSKNVRLEPCGHLLCDFCLMKWQKSFRYQGCPFCRFEIKGIARIALIPYRHKPESKESPRRICPAVPPRLSSNSEPPSKLNYAKLDWLSLNDSGYGVYSNYDGADAANEAAVDSQSSETAPIADKLQYENVIDRQHYLNVSACSTADLLLPPAEDGSEAMRHLLKITGNDVPMSKEILRFFALRSMTTAT